MFDLSTAPKIVASKKQSSFRIVALADTDIPEIQIMDAIGENIFGEGVSAVSVKEFLGQNRGDVIARFNSSGGDAFEGLCMGNLFQEHGRVTALVDGLAFSAAAIAAVGANRLVMKEASSFGIHHSHTIVQGNAAQLRGVIEWLDSVDAHQVDLFAAKTGKSKAQIAEWLEGTSDGTIFTAKEALAAGFADEVVKMKKRVNTKFRAYEIQSRKMRSVLDLTAKPN